MFRKGNNIKSFINIYSKVDWKTMQDRCSWSKKVQNRYYVMKQWRNQLKDACWSVMVCHIFSFSNVSSDEGDTTQSHLTKSVCAFHIAGHKILRVSKSDTFCSSLESSVQETEFFIFEIHLFRHLYFRIPCYFGWFSTLKSFAWFFVVLHFIFCFSPSH